MVDLPHDAGSKSVEQGGARDRGRAARFPGSGVRSRHGDGDTIELGEMAIRLQGLAAPEWSEPGGVEARTAMVDLVQGRTVRCELDGSRTYDRCAGICYLDGQDIAAVLVQQGLARDCPRYSGGRYQRAEQAAAADGATIRGAYELPGYCRAR
jgi:micrococcal nuclease